MKTRQLVAGKIIFLLVMILIPLPLAAQEGNLLQNEYFDDWPAPTAAPENWDFDEDEMESYFRSEEGFVGKYSVNIIESTLTEIDLDQTLDVTNDSYATVPDEIYVEAWVMGRGFVAPSIQAGQTSHSYSGNWKVIGDPDTESDSDWTKVTASRATGTNDDEPWKLRLRSTRREGDSGDPEFSEMDLKIGAVWFGDTEDFNRFEFLNPPLVEITHPDQAEIFDGKIDVRGKTEGNVNVGDSVVVTVNGEDTAAGKVGADSTWVVEDRSLVPDSENEIVAKLHEGDSQQEVVDLDSISVMQVDVIYDVSAVYGYPNPFKPSQHDFVRIRLPEGAPEDIRRITIFNIRGQRIDRFEVNSPVDARWYGENHAGSSVSSGTYIFVVETENGQIGRTTVTKVR